MKNKIALPGLLLVVSALLLAAPRAGAEDADAIKKKLQRNVSFEFVDTPLEDAVNFLRTLTNVTMIIDPKVLAAKPPTINLRVADMSMDRALQWILKLAELEYVVTEGSIYISTPDGIRELNRVAGVDPKNNKKQPAADAGDGVLRARFATGDTIEIDAPLMKKYPDLAREVLSMVFDPARDEILVLAPGRDIPPHVPVEQFIESAKKVAPQAVLNYDANLKLLMITSADEGELHKLNAVARALRKAGNPKDDPFGGGKNPVKNFKAEAELEALRDEAKRAQIEDGLAQKVKQLQMDVRAKTEMDQQARIKMVQQRRMELDMEMETAKKKAFDDFNNNNKKAIKPPKPPADVPDQF